MSIYTDAYREIHRLEKRFPGYSIKAYLDDIAALVKSHGTMTMLDFGCGKAKGYTERNYHDAWGGNMPRLYDPGVPTFSKKPTGQFGGVICSDVMEHIPETDVPSILDELIGYVEPGGWLFLGISCRPANKSFKGGVLDGQNLHLTVRQPSWWEDQVGNAVERADLDVPDIHIVAHWDIAGHFDCDDKPWDSWT